MTTPMLLAALLTPSVIFGFSLASRQLLSSRQRQRGYASALWSFVDDFRYLAVLCFICAPIALAMVKVRHRGGPSMSH